MDRQQAGKQSLLVIFGCGVLWGKAGNKVSAGALYVLVITWV